MAGAATAATFNDVGDATDGDDDGSGKSGGRNDDARDPIVLPRGR